MDTSLPQPEKPKKRKWVRIIIMGLIILLTLVIIFSIYFIITGYQKTDTGWSYEFNFGSTLYRKICEMRGGAWSYEGGLYSIGPYYCDYPYEDADKPCTNSSQCQGKCLADESDIRAGQNLYESGCEVCIGKCAKYRIVEGSRGYSELNNGVVNTVIPID